MFKKVRALSLVFYNFIAGNRKKPVDAGFKFRSSFQDFKISVIPLPY